MKKYTNGTFTGTYRECCNHLNASLPRNHPENWPQGPWEVVQPAPAAPLPLEQVQQSAISEINAIYEQIAEQQAGKWPWFERSTWADQEQEALAYRDWEQTGSTGTPPNTTVLTGIATERGITVSELAARVIANATAWRSSAPVLAGQRQAACDAINAATTAAEVQQILDTQRSRLNP